MPKYRTCVLILLLLFMGSLAIPVHAQSSIQVISDAATNTFPESIAFQAEFHSGVDISSVVLEYGVNQLTCGTVEAKAFPTFTPAADVKVEWDWEMRQSGSLAPGVSVWWRWQVMDANGVQFITPTKTILWLDGVHPWQVITGGNINLHYYNGGASFGDQLHQAATQALVRLSQDVGVSTDSPVDIFVYANTSDLQEAVLYEPSWAGGQAFPQDNIIIIGISTDQLDWGKSTEAHELAHVLVGHLIFSCLGFIPTWLNEGLAVYSAGGPIEYEQTLFNQAVAGNTLMSLRSLGGNFPETDAGYLAYAESYSVVNFLIKTYGRDKMNTLLLAIRDGATADEALTEVYRFDVDGLDAAWRTSIGVAPSAGSSRPDAVSTPTEVPTFVPVGGPPAAQAGLSTPGAGVGETPAAPASHAQGAGSTATALPSTSQPGHTLPDMPTVLEIGLGILAFAALLAGLVTVIILVVRGRNRSAR